ncbi:MAG TPA: FlgD immunoglobulin-like domain containing protein [Candidatus Krumholzibacteria bacterium]|nr:FlgD immunoglobulin-like domain containing protein [Candidatus Krumholzibacteria bacterium]
MSRKFMLIMMLAVLASVPALAAVPGGHGFLDALDQAVAAGELDAGTALQHKFAYMFDQDALPEAWRPAAFEPLKCGTEIMREFEILRPTLSADVVKRLDAYLTPEMSAATATYLSPLGHFNFTYFTSGTNGVSATDVNPANGIPDYVERCAQYMDESWEKEIVEMGFTAPPTHPYPVSFESMGSYGYTTVVSGTATRIVLHNTFIGFPPNDDPDGNVLGAAKVTCAHEFKHASQRAQSGWSEGGWVELDATWMEDVVYDQVNDYYNYLTSGSGISSPTSSLDTGGSGSYEDCIFQHWMSETWGDQIIIDLWDWRSTHTTQSMLVSYDSILFQNGSSLVNGYPEFAAWNYACGVRSVAGFGYGEAADYNSSAVTTVSTYPYSLSSSTAHLAARNFHCINFGALDREFQVTFNGQNATDLSVKAVIRLAAGGFVYEDIPLDANNDVADYPLSVTSSAISTVGIVVVNSRASGLSATWDVSFALVDPTPIAAAAVSPTFLAETVETGDLGSALTTVSNVGQAGSVLNYVVQEMDIDPVSYKAAAAALLPRAEPAPRAMDELTVKPQAASPVTYNGDCVYGNDDTSSIPGYYGSWWTGQETYAVRVDPLSESCSCVNGFNVRGVHMLLYLQTTSTPQVRALLAEDAGGVPGAILDTSAPITVSPPVANGYVDVEIPTDFSCADPAAGPYYVLFEFLDANGPVGIPIDAADTAGLCFNDWGTGWVDLSVQGFVGDIMLWADVDCCDFGVPQIGVLSPNGGEYLQTGTSTDITWSATSTDFVDVELSTDNGLTWTLLFDDTANDGSESWLVAGASTVEALVRVSSPDGLVSDVSDAPFLIFSEVSWMSVSPDGAGSLLGGSSQDLTVSLDATGLAEGVYTGYILVAHDAGAAEVVTVELSVTDSGSAVGDTPLVFGLAGNHPNPFNPTTRLLFTLPTAGAATVDVLDLQGRVVRTLHRGDLPQGRTSLEWDGRDDAGRAMASGTYLARLRAGGMTATHKMSLTK